MAATVRGAPADAGMAAFEVLDTPERLRAMYPIAANVTVPEGGPGSYRMRGIRFRTVEQLDAFRERHPDFTVTVQT